MHVHKDDQERKKSEYILTPHGRIHRSCVHRAECEDAPPAYEPCKHPPNDLAALRDITPHGWIESASFSAPVPLGRMTFQLTVPDEPVQKRGALIYLFAGAQDMQLTTILQPVLQWGFNGEFGGDHWCIAAWYAQVSGRHGYSSSRRVEPGDVIQGTVSVKSCSDNACLWQISITRITDEGIAEKPLCTQIVLPALMLFVVGGALEAYPLDCCGETDTSPDAFVEQTQYPASRLATFSDIVLTDLAGVRMAPAWFKQSYSGKGPNFGFHVDTSAQEITLKF